jgi:hypothetical protein
MSNSTCRRQQTGRDLRAITVLHMMLGLLLLVMLPTVVQA